MPDRVNLPIEPTGQQETISININKKVLAYKYMLTDTGVIFVTDTDSLPPDKDATISMAKGNNKTVFLHFGKVYALVTEAIIEHLKSVMGKSKEITISFAQSQLDEYEIKVGFSLTLDQVNCATLISLYKIAGEK